MGRLARSKGRDKEVVQRLGTTRHLSLTGGTNAHQAGRISEAVDLAFIGAVIQDLLAFADAREMPAIRHTAEAASEALMQELERSRTARLEVMQ